MSRKREPMSLRQWATYSLIIAAALALVGVLGYLQWHAYFQRFPDAEWWTFFFQGK